MRTLHARQMWRLSAHCSSAKHATCCVPALWSCGRTGIETACTMAAEIDELMLQLKRELRVFHTFELLLGFSLALLLCRCARWLGCLAS